jgi:hypothetical protein
MYTGATVINCNSESMGIRLCQVQEENTGHSSRDCQHLFLLWFLCGCHIRSELIAFGYTVMQSTFCMYQYQAHHGLCSWSNIKSFASPEKYFLNMRVHYRCSHWHYIIGLFRDWLQTLNTQAPWAHGFNKTSEWGLKDCWMQVLSNWSEL